MNVSTPLARWRRTLGRSAAILVSAAGLGLAHVAPASALVFDVSLDTSLLSGDAQLAFDLIDGDFAVNNTATISDFMLTMPSALNGPDIRDGDVTGGPLPADVVIGDSSLSGINTLYQPIVLGGTISFRLTLTEFDASGPMTFPDAFALSLLEDTPYDPTDPMSFPPLPLYDTDDPGGALLFIDLADQVPVIALPLNTQDPFARLTVTTVDAPAPAALALMGMALLLVGARTRSRA